jgi:hypothetical protein
MEVLPMMNPLNHMSCSTQSLDQLIGTFLPLSQFNKMTAETTKHSILFILFLKKNVICVLNILLIM